SRAIRPRMGRIAGSAPISRSPMDESYFSAGPPLAPIRTARSYQGNECDLTDSLETNGPGGRVVNNRGIRSITRKAADLGKGFQEYPGAEGDSRGRFHGHDGPDVGRVGLRLRGMSYRGRHR